GAEELTVVADADMLEHADRDDTVERPGDMAIVLEEEADAIAQSLLGRAAIGDRELLIRKRDPRHVDLGVLGEIEAEAAPARADVEDALAGLEGEFRREMPLLGE